MHYYIPKRGGVMIAAMLYDAEMANQGIGWFPGKCLPVIE